MIYGYLLIDSAPISITSPKPIDYKSPKSQNYLGRRSYPSNSPALKSFVALSRTNRAIRADVATIFFGKNTFIIGNGPHGSYRFSNLHAMRSLIRRLSSPTLSLIRRVIFCVSHGRWRVPSEQELEDLVSIAKIFVRHFTGVRRVLFENNRNNLSWMGWEKESKMMATMAVNEVLKKQGIEGSGIMAGSKIYLWEIGCISKERAGRHGKGF